MRTRNIPYSYFYNLREEVEWKQVLPRLGIKFKQTKKGLSIYETKCVFHEDKTPSLVFNPSQGIFHCFGCGKSGDIHSFVSFVLTGKSSYNQKTCRWFKKCFNIPLPWSR